MKTQHTQGPWLLTGIQGSDALMVGGDLDGSQVIADIRTGEDYQQSEADARLIASAPDLLAALRMALSSLAYLKDKSAHLGEKNAEHAGDCLVFRTAYEAINKAEGRA